MRVMIRRRATIDTLPAELLEIVTPRTNAATVTPAENLFAAISLADPFSLEIAATRETRRFLVRTGRPAMQAHLAEQLSVAYPQAGFRWLDPERDPGLDPARRGPDEQVRACALVLRSPPYLPIRTFRDAEVAADRSAQADPVLGIVGALGEVPPGWRTLSQLVLRPAPDDWCRGYLRLAVDHPLAKERAAGRADTSLTSVILLAGLLTAGCLGLVAYRWYLAGQWPQLALLGAAGASAAQAPSAWRAVSPSGRSTTRAWSPRRSAGWPTSPRCASPSSPRRTVRPRRSRRGLAGSRRPTGSST